MIVCDTGYTTHIKNRRDQRWTFLYVREIVFTVTRVIIPRKREEHLGR